MRKGIKSLKYKLSSITSIKDLVSDYHKHKLSNITSTNCQLPPVPQFSISIFACLHFIFAGEDAIRLPQDGEVSELEMSFGDLAGSISVLDFQLE